MVSQTQNLIAFENQYCAQNYAPLPVVIEKAQDVWMWDVNGQKYLDFLGGYSALSHGHGHPQLIKTLVEQVHILSMTSRAVYTKNLAKMSEKLCAVSGLSKVLPMNTGAEAVDTALKAARRWGYQKKKIPTDKAEIIVAHNNFHGRTMGAVSLSSTPSSRKHFGPLLQGIQSVPFGDIEAIKHAVTPHTCAVFLEPIQGEAGVILPPPGYLKAVRELTQQNQILLILDEIQSGLGRTGKWFCFQHENILPDGITVGKALGGGLLPISAFLAHDELMSVFDPGSHGSTFGGNPLACAVGLKALEVLEEEDLIVNSAQLGQYLCQRLKSFDFKVVEAVRCLGLWAAIDLDPSILTGKETCLLLLKKGLITKETRDHTIRIAPPLTITKKNLDWGLAQIECVLKST